MTAKERVRAALRGQPLDRFPFWYGADSAFTEKLVATLGAHNEDDALYQKLGVDCKTIRPFYTGPELPRHADRSITTEWGIRRGGLYGGQALFHPLAHAENARELDAYPFPDPARYRTVFSEAEIDWAKDYCLIGGCWAPFFHDVCDLVGMEKHFIDMIDNPPLAHALIDKCFAFYYELNGKVLQANAGLIDIVFMGNDFGSQWGLLMSPELWCTYYKKPLRMLVEQAKAHGCAVAFHSCGSIRPLIPDLIDIGIDILNPIQVNARDMDPQVLMDEFGDDLVFFGGIDENEILRCGTEQVVREETRRILSILGRKGKYIVAASHDYLLPEVPAENIIAMYDEAKGFRP